MKLILRSIVYFFCVFATLWLLLVVFFAILAFSYTDHFLSWIPYIVLGGWVPGKLYGLTLLHTIICISVSINVIGYFDCKFEIGRKTRTIMLLLIAAFFCYEGVSNLFFRDDAISKIIDYKRMGLLQGSFLIGLLIKAFNPDVEMD